MSSAAGMPLRSQTAHDRNVLGRCAQFGAPRPSLLMECVGAC